MTGTQRRRVAAAAAAAGLLLTTLFPLPSAGAATAQQVASLGLTVVRVTPSTPLPSQVKRTLSIVVELHNTGTTDLQNVQVLARRGDPIESQRSLDRSLADTDPVPSGSDVKIPPTRPVTPLNIAAGATVTTTFVTTTNIPTDGGLCLCANAVYPIELSAVGDNGTGTLLGSTRTYLPSFDVRPTPVQVSWVWPLIDRPHRLGSGTVFLDDDLADLVDGGRLDSSLRVVEEVGPSVPMTLVIDPELLDELEVMASGKYTIERTSGRVIQGTGRQAAANWLGRLASVLRTDPVSVDLIPYADPDVQTLSRHHLSWTGVMPPAMRVRVVRALAGRTPRTDIAWPAGGAIGTRTLRKLAGGGARTVILNRAAVSPSSSGNLPASLARLRGAGGHVVGALTSAAIQNDVASTVSLGGSGLSTLPQLVAELAIRYDWSASQGRPTAEHVVFLTPPRYVYPDVDAARAAILSTSAGPFTRPVNVRDVTRSNLVPPGRSKLRSVRTTPDSLAPDILSRASATARAVPAVRALLGRDQDARTLLTNLPSALQQIKSTAWRSDTTGSVGGASLGRSVSRRVSAQVAQIMSGVRIVNPPSSSYTLAASTSKLPITVSNTLPYVVYVRLDVKAAGALPGFTAGRIRTTRIMPNSKQTLKVPVHLQRSGRIRILAQLHTTNHVDLGGAVKLSVHSTVLGAVGVAITVVAGVVLFLALLLRYVRRIQRLRRKRRGGTKPVSPAANVPAAASATSATSAASAASAAEPADGGAP